MLFNSYEFLFGFLPLAVAVYFIAGRFLPQTGMWPLAIASLGFYAWWEIRFLPILLVSVVFNFFAGRQIVALVGAGRGKTAGTMLRLAILANLLALAWFKYVTFLAGSLNALLGLDLPQPDIALPIGISFFTFTQIAFLVDASRGKVGETKPSEYLLFVTYFPHLIAGPILHHAEMMPQFRAPRARRPDFESLAVGFTVFVIGLFKKLVLADGAAPIADHGFAAASLGTASASVAWAGALGYAMQIYFDFSAYCDMAIGISRMFNISLPANFESPYKATSIVEFWRRWHMTLSRFLRDYLYIPLGGNRAGPTRRYANLLTTMLLGGLWHGANWTFVAWGGLHGAYLIINHLWSQRRPPRPSTWYENLLGQGLTFIAVVVAWVFFRAANMAEAWQMLTAMAGLSQCNGACAATPGGKVQLSLAVMFAIVWLAPNLRQIMAPHRLVLDGSGVDRTRLTWRPNLGWAIACLVLFAISLSQMVHISQFLYFQF